MSDMTRDEIRMYLDTARAEAKASAAEVAKSQAELRADLKAGIAAVSVDVANLKIDFSDLKSDLHAALAVQTKWIAAMGFGLVAAVGAINGMFKPDSRSAPAPVKTPAPYANYARPVDPMSKSTLRPTPATLPDLSGRP
jgi:hypothetical protein